MNPMMQAIQALNAQTLKLQADFIAFIQDRTIPLEERWETWVQAPVSMKNTLGYTCHLNSLPEDYIAYDGPVYAERYETILTESVVERTLELLDEDEDGSYEAGSYENRVAEAKLVDVDALREEILQKNLYSFTYDW